jgi:hypothetical protein
VPAVDDGADSEGLFVVDYVDSGRDAAGGKLSRASAMRAAYGK